MEQTTMIEEYSKYAGELSECKSKEDRDSWLSGFGAFILGWQASEKRRLTQDAADLLVCTCEQVAGEVIGEENPNCPLHGSASR
jgi:hypothetical protein